jgi:hypothetical protein
VGHATGKLRARIRGHVLKNATDDITEQVALFPGRCLGGHKEVTDPIQQLTPPLTRRLTRQIRKSV